MTDNRTAWLAILQRAQRRQAVYSGLIVEIDLALGKIEALLSPSGEATDQLVNIGLDLTPVARSRASNDVMAVVQMVSRDHTRAIGFVRSARNTVARAHTYSMMILARIQRAIDEIGGV